MNDVLKFGLLGVGGYLLYNYFFAAPAAAPASASSTPATSTGYQASSSAGQTQPSAVTTTTPSQTLALVTAYAQRNKLATMMNADQWNWVAIQVGVNPPDVLVSFPQIKSGQLDRVKYLMTAATWYAQASQHGLAGFTARGSKNYGNLTL